jgi:hypothetical protein
MMISIHRSYVSERKKGTLTEELFLQLDFTSQKYNIRMILFQWIVEYAEVAELADALDSGSSGE